MNGTPVVGSPFRTAFSSMSAWSRTGLMAVPEISALMSLMYMKGGPGEWMGRRTVFIWIQAFSLDGSICLSEGILNGLMVRRYRQRLWPG